MHISALDKYINDRVNGIDNQDDFPKNESSWEELFNLCERLIAEIVILRRNAERSESTKAPPPTSQPGG